MSDFTTQTVMWGALAGQYLLGFIAFFYLARAAWEHKPRFVHLLAARIRVREVPVEWLQLLRLTRTHPSMKERERLLAGCGVTWDAAWYVLLRRGYFMLLPIWGLAAWGLTHVSIEGVPAVTAPLLLILFTAALMWDQFFLAMFRRVRAERMTKEIYVVSSQLLYLAGSSLHIHTKLMRCLPYVKVMRADLQLLLGEWYHDAEGAVRRFKQRLGTEEGLSFAETIDSLRLHDSEHYYELLRERIKDYKEKLELAKESRKESSSYVLFVLAGLPIMYTFQVFIYPWVREGQKLFQSLN